MRTLSKLLCLSTLAWPACLHAQLPVGELYASDASIHGSVSLTSGGTTVLTGSSISSGNGTALLRLSRGGELAICTGTRVSVSASASGRDLMFSFGEGTIEARYRISSAADAIVTPDLRLLVTGPGDFDVSVGVSPNGDTCVRSGSRSSGGVIVSEMMGDGTYQVKPSELVVFRGGRVAGAQLNPGEVACGCPAPTPAAIALVKNPELKPRKMNLPPSLQQPSYSPPEAPKPEHVQADLRLSFSGRQEPDLGSRIIRLSVRQFDLPAALTPVVLPPSEPVRKTDKRGFWRKLGSWFSGRGYQ